MSQNCECAPESGVNLPVNGLSLNVDPSVLGCLSREDVEDIVRGLLVANPGGGIVPNLRIGVETLYPALYEGKQVYAQLVDFGALPNNTNKSIAHNIPDMEWFMLSEEFSRVTKSNGTYSYSTTCLTPTSLTSAWYWTLTTTNVALSTGRDRREHSAVLCILYTKTTDPVIC